MQCLILAAGRGSRLQSKADCKPLLPLLGVPLIERSIRAARAAGADSFLVVTGHRAERLEAFLEGLSARLSVPIRCVRNPDWDRLDNGASVLAAREHLEGDFLLLMADHLLGEGLLRRLLSCPPPPGGLTLAVDSRLDNPLVDPADVTRIWQEEGRIRRIGKGLEPCNGYDTGAFHATPALFESLEACLEEGENSLSAAVQRLAEEGRARACDVSGQFWIDVDDPHALAQAEQALLEELRGKPTDGPVARHLNRPLSTRLTRLLVRTPVTPNQISLFSFACSLLAALLIALPHYATLALGGALAQFASIVDGCDGEVARLKYLSSDYGGWLDAVLDRYADALLLFACAWHAFQEGAGTGALVWGFGAMLGAFMLSYTADKYDARMRRRIESGLPPGLRIGRDVRVFLLMLFTLAGQPLAYLVLTALVMNGETLRRIVVLKAEIDHDSRHRATA